ncbi:hypothetical protein CYMTET_51823 [Cymbomonas tetramitiformis]|uniref:Probable magnesium transporter n=1 Tax=Cymbomonas tetramitiformis TaxID=36881 RepID=A0AAE0BKB1_9CHLO|nr:hypothetical protein CYMTET_51823 [Cymbomonas tetramitiformis]
MASFALGVILTVLSSIFGWTLTVNIWRYAHRQQKTGQGRTSLYTAPAWWIGVLGAFIDMAGDEFGSGLVGQSVSVPLTTGTLLAINPIWAWILNRERCYVVPDGVGSLVIVCGAILMFLVADDDVEEYDWDDVKDHLTSSSSITGFALVVLLAATLYVVIWKTSSMPAESTESPGQMEVGDEKHAAAAGFGLRQQQWRLFPHKDSVTTNVTKFSYAGLVAALQALTCSLTVAVSYWLWSVIDGDDNFSFTNLGPLLLYLTQKLAQLVVCVATSAATVPSHNPLSIPTFSPDVRTFQFVGQPALAFPTAGMLTQMKEPVAPLCIPPATSLLKA